MQYGRLVESGWRRRFRLPHVHVIFGARQTGKSTLLRELVPDPTLAVDLSDPRQRSAYLKDPGRLVAECRALPSRRGPARITVDEAQNVPAIFDSVQHLYDSDRHRWLFYLCGSSARKMRLSGANLLPGRALLYHLYPLVMAERPLPESRSPSATVLPFTGRARPRIAPLFPQASLMDRMLFGELPGIATEDPSIAGDLLDAYAQVYLEEELRREGLIKDWSAFARFLRLAAVESGQTVNHAKIAREAGVSQPTVKAHYQLLEDMFIGFRVPAFSGSSRKSLLSTERFFFFDLGVRHAAAELPFEKGTVLGHVGPIFEQWVGIELWKRLCYRGRGRLLYYRTRGGSEIDFIVDDGAELLPVEVKWTERPDRSDAASIESFLSEHRRAASRGFIICRCERPQSVTDRVTAVPWHAF